jgi:hypothetical protein
MFRSAGIKFGLAVLTAAVTMACATVSQAATFASFTQTTSTANVSWVNPGNNTTGGSFFTTTTGGVQGSTAISFKFLAPGVSPTLAAAVNNVPAVLTLSSVANLGNPADLSALPFIDQPGLHGSFSITYTGIPDLIVGLVHYHTGANLLSGVFQFGNIQGTRQSSSGSVIAATASGSVLTYTSAFLNFTHSVQRDFSLNLTSITPLMDATAGKALKSFTASSGGSFSAQPIPEPATWVMMITGFGALGVAIRRRRSKAASPV